MIASISFNGSPALSSPPSGWSLIQACNNGSGAKVAAWSKVATGSEPSTYTFSWTGNQFAIGGIAVYSGVSNAQPVAAADISGCHSSGSATSATVTGFTPTSQNTLVIWVLAMVNNSSNGDAITSTGPTRIHWGAAWGSCGVLCNTNVAGAHFNTNYTSGSTGNQTFNSAVNLSSTWSAFQFALQPYSVMTQSGFRFLSNTDNGAAQYVTSNPSSGDDTLAESVMDTVNGYFYTAGYDTRWIIERRNISDGSLDTSFGTGGQVIEDIAGSAVEKIGGMALDLKEGMLYVAGTDTTAGAGNEQWRIEKRSITDGSLVSGFGTGGVVTTNPTSGTDEINDLIVDNITGYLIAGGYDSTGGNEWRIEKRSLITGALDTNFQTGGVLLFNPSGRPEMVSAMAIDEGGGYFYVTGVDDGAGNTRWRVEKRKISNGNLCTAAECGTLFGTGGAYVDNPTNGGDQPLTIQVDIAGNALFFGGYDNNGGQQWRIAKVDATTGAAISAFGTSGIVTANPSANADQITQLALDGKGGYLYVIGTDGTGSDIRWRIEKRQRSDGSLVSSFGTSGVITINPSANTDPPTGVMIDVDRSLLWAVGGDRSLGATNMQWRYEQFITDDGSRWLGAANTTTVASTSISFRLRILIHASTAGMVAGDYQFKLQYAFKVGTCDTAFTGEIWSDVATNSGEIRYHDNASLTDATTAIGVTGDPTHNADPITLETYEESNHNGVATKESPGTDGMWDLSLQDFGAFGAYCFRVVKSDGALLDSYSYVPEISFCKDDPRAENVMRHGTFFCEGTKRAFFWAN
jgi:hypothetical protein